MRVPDTPSYQSLLEENRRLKAELSQRSVGLDLETGLVRIRNLHTPDVTVEALDVRVPDAPHLVENMVNLQTLLKGGGKLQLPSLEALGTAPMQVEQARVQVPEETANRALQQVGGGLLAREGIKDLHLDFEEGNRLALTGTLDKLIDIPFRLEGTLSRENDRQLRFSLDKTRVLGFVPVPRLVTDIFTAMASRHLEEAHVEQQDQAFLVDIGAFIPTNVSVGLRSLTTHDGYLVVEGGSPG